VADGYAKFMRMTGSHSWMNSQMQNKALDWVNFQSDSSDDK